MKDISKARKQKYAKSSGPRGKTGAEQAKEKRKAEQAKQVEPTEFVYARHRKSFQKVQKIPLTTWQRFTPAQRMEYAVQYSDDDGSAYRLGSHPASAVSGPPKVFRSIY